MGSEQSNRLEARWRVPWRWRRSSAQRHRERVHDQVQISPRSNSERTRGRDFSRPLFFGARQAPRLASTLSLLRSQTCSQRRAPEGGEVDTFEVRTRLSGSARSSHALRTRIPSSVATSANGGRSGGGQ